MNEMPYTRPLSEVTKEDVASVGGKGANLGELMRAGFQVPRGFAVCAEAFEKFLKETDLYQEVDTLLDGVDHDAIHTAEEASEKIRGLILNAEVPSDISKEIRDAFKELQTDKVAVRSSATAEDSETASWAGQLDSFLNVTKEGLLGSVKKCWASLFTPRAIFYRFEKGLHGKKISVAVVVQKMVPAEAAGVAFSVHPVTEDENHLIIEAVRGLGEALVSGVVTPDSYTIEKKPRKIIDSNPAGQQKGGTPILPENEILQLADIVIQIEKHFGVPQDVEWAYANDTFYIVQSRPITTLKGR